MFYRFHNLLHSLTQLNRIPFLTLCCVCQNTLRPKEILLLQEPQRHSAELASCRNQFWDQKVFLKVASCEL